MTPCRSTRVIINLCLVLSILGTACWRGPWRSFCRPSIPCTTPSKAATEVVRARAPGRYLPRDGSGYPSASSLIGARPLVLQLVHGDPRSSTAVVRAATCRRLVSHILEHMMMLFDQHRLSVRDLQRGHAPHARCKLAPTVIRLLGQALRTSDLPQQRRRAQSANEHVA